MFVLSIVLTSLFSLFYVTREGDRFLHRGWAKNCSYLYRCTAMILTWWKLYNLITLLGVLTSESKLPLAYKYHFSWYIYFPILIHIFRTSRYIYEVSGIYILLIHIFRTSRYIYEVSGIYIFLIHIFRTSRYIYEVSDTYIYIYIYFFLIHIFRTWYIYFELHDTYMRFLMYIFSWYIFFELHDTYIVILVYILFIWYFVTIGAS